MKSPVAEGPEVLMSVVIMQGKIASEVRKRGEAEQGGQGLPGATSIFWSDQEKAGHQASKIQRYRISGRRPALPGLLPVYLPPQCLLGNSRNDGPTKENKYGRIGNKRSCQNGRVSPEASAPREEC